MQALQRLSGHCCLYQSIPDVQWTIQCIGGLPHCTSPIQMQPVHVCNAPPLPSPSFKVIRFNPLGRTSSHAIWHLCLCSLHPLPLLYVLTCCVGQEKRAEASKLRVSMKLVISDGESAVKQRLMSKNTRKGLFLQGAVTERNVTSSRLLAQQQDQDTAHIDCTKLPHCMAIIKIIHARLADLPVAVKVWTETASS